MTDFTYEGPGDYVSQNGDHIEVIGLTADETTIVGVTKHKVGCTFDAVTGEGRRGVPEEWSLTHKYVEPLKREPVAVLWNKYGQFRLLYTSSIDGPGWLANARKLADKHGCTLQIINPDNAPLPEDSE